MISERPVVVEVSGSERVGSLQGGVLRAAYLSGSLGPVDVVDVVFERVAARGEDGVWIHLLDRARVRSAAAALADRWEGVELPPLFGVPFAVKDNIAVAGVPTTAGCPARTGVAEENAPLVDLLVAAGALLIGTTNLDQFATGLTGTRSPFGIPVCPFDPTRVAGGSSSGSAVAVATGLVSFAVGTDTAGSGRVPASFTATVGVKPSRGRVSTRGLVPACRSLDCPSVFALNVSDCAEVLAVLDHRDPADPYSRRLPSVPHRVTRAAPARVRVGVPPRSQLEFEDDDAARAWQSCLDQLDAMGAERAEIDLDPFLAAGQLLYSGPWLAERWAAFGDFLIDHPEEVNPVVAEVVRGGREVTGAAVFRGQHELAELRRRSEMTWGQVEVMLLPTTPEHPTIDAVAHDPIGVNERLGRWTTFANLLDLAAVVVPATRTRTGLPVGAQLLGPAGSEATLLSLAAAWESFHAMEAGATGHPVLAAAPAPQTVAHPAEDGRTLLTVVGAHLSGQPLNPVLVELGARLHDTTPTAATYRLVSLPGGPPARPGLVRVRTGGSPVEAETWSVPTAGLGTLLTTVPPPLGIGHVDLADGTTTLGFVCEAAGAADALDITDHGGWRAYLAVSTRSACAAVTSS